MKVFFSMCLCVVFRQFGSQSAPTPAEPEIGSPEEIQQFLSTSGNEVFVIPTLREKRTITIKGTMKASDPDQRQRLVFGLVAQKQGDVVTGFAVDFANVGCLIEADFSVATGITYAIKDGQKIINNDAIDNNFDTKLFNDDTGDFTMLMTMHRKEISIILNNSEFRCYLIHVVEDIRHLTWGGDFKITELSYGLD